MAKNHNAENNSGESDRDFLNPTPEELEECEKQLADEVSRAGSEEIPRMSPQEVDSLINRAKKARDQKR
ncbi:MAG: hypothetical protein K0S38_1055 [Candidatus Paceibacter sp.]|jgi:hypothetical protein|nr:hypothetical protein [Candidatus Paceibacter sp.]